MKTKIPKKLINTKYRKEMWDNTQKIIKKLEKVLPISSAYLLGSFTTKKSRPADVDFILLLQMKEKNKSSKWSVDIALSPDNKYGEFIVEDAKKWMDEKYGSENSAVIKLK